VNTQHNPYIVGRQTTTRGGNLWQGSRVGRGNERKCYQGGDKVMNEHGTLQVAIREAYCRIQGLYTTFRDKISINDA